jgi:shikimate dehydrogenase
MKISGKTQVYGILGYPVKHSLSPVFQNASFEYFSVDAVYVPFEVEPKNFNTAFLGLKALGVKGVNITLPFKERALELCDLLDEHAKQIGAVNTVKFENQIEGYNTDWIGFLKALKDLEGDIKNKKVLVLGAGGTSKAVFYALSKEGCYVYVWNRTVQKALELAERFSLHVVSNPEDVLDDVDIIVNTTSVGLSERDPHLFDYEKIRENHTVFDVIYKRTPLLEKALEKGAKAQDGLIMLLYQGIESFRIWTNMEVPLSVVKESLSSYILN